MSTFNSSVPMIQTPPQYKDGSPSSTDTYENPIHKTGWSLLSAGVLGSWITVMSLMPYYNKLALKVYPYPITASSIQVGFTALFLAIFDTIVHYRLHHRPSTSDLGFTGFINTEELPPSWLGSHGFQTKVRHLILPAIFFALVIITTNVGIERVPAYLQVLLHSSEVFWMVGFTWLFTPDTPSIAACGIAAVVMTGSILTASFNAASGVPFGVIVLNLMPAFFSPLQLITLRRAALFLKDATKRDVNQPDLSHMFGEMRVTEMTCIKMCIALIPMIGAALIYEVGILNPTSFQAFHQSFGASCNFGLLMLGVLMTLLFQSLAVASASFVEPVAVGLFQQSKVILSFAVGFLVANQVVNVCKCQSRRLKCPKYGNPKKELIEKEHLAGVILILLGVAAYAILKSLNKHLRKPKTLNQRPWPEDELSPSPL